ncbi:flagellar biosynthesis protein FlhA [Spirochaetia bacterium 38H-sp]|uniref:Flagellar biosynthesis protein FlhA n=1 Tax=Rarispira pelagica TaxID=3141764 RepID=A0ABU9UD98_9SPIR
MADIPQIFRSSFLNQRSDVFVAIGVIAVVMMLIIPMPPVLLDTLMSLNLVISLLTILIVLSIKRALEFSVFPTLLLVLTVFGLSLNVSSTRLILNQGSKFQGKLVKAFSTFVVGSGGQEGLVVGFIIFIILIAVQFIVITKGATRVAEVAARFTLDALPGKQMAIEAEYNSGAISEEEAARKKAELQREADFYGAMDGASKFVSGNVKVGLLITVVNILGGIIVGMAIHGEPFSVALTTYISLTIGDGLVSQFPALLVSTATGLIVTRAISDGTFGEDVSTQFAGEARIYWIAAGFLIFLAILPGFPWYVLLPMAFVLGFVAYRLSLKSVRSTDTSSFVDEKKSSAHEEQQELSPVVPLDPISLEIGYALIPLVDREKGAELLERITRIRKETALELGIVIPRIRIMDNMRLEPSEYSVKIKGVNVGRGVIKMGHYLCINPGGVSEELEGEETRDPAFGLPAIWIREEDRDRAERAGYTVVDPPSIIATHLTEIIKQHASELLGRQEVQSMLNALRENYPAVVDDVLSDLTLGDVQKVLQGLLLEQVSIRNLVTILETMSDFARISKEHGFLIEKTRQALGRQICAQYTDENNTLYVITIDPVLEQRIIDSRVETASGYVPALEPDLYRKWINSVMNAINDAQQQGYIPVVLCQEVARALVKNSTLRDIPDLVVLSVPEIPQDVRVEAVGEIRVD